MTQIKNNNELNLFMSKTLQKAVDYITDCMLKELKDEIMRTVYDSGTPAFYQRTQTGSEGNDTSFLDSWETVAATIKGNIVSGQLIQNFLGMALDADNFVHGSNYYEPNDIREKLADIIFKGLSGDLFGTNGFWMKERDAWTPFIKTIEKDFDRWFKEGMALSGITNVQNISISWRQN